MRGEEAGRLNRGVEDVVGEAVRIRGGLPTICKGPSAGSGCPPWRMRILVFAVTHAARAWLRRLGWNVVWLSSIAQPPVEPPHRAPRRTSPAPRRNRQGTMSGTFLRRRDRTARPPRVEHYSSAVNTGPGARTSVTLAAQRFRSDSGWEAPRFSDGPGDPADAVGLTSRVRLPQRPHPASLGLRKPRTFSCRQSSFP